jgi:DNA topoisomerase-1
VRLGRSAPFLQRGDGGEGNVVSVPKGLYYDELTVERGLALLDASSRAAEGLGNDPKTGLCVYAFVGPYGPYVQLGTGEGKEKPKRASLPKGTPIEGVTLEVALNYLSLPRTLGTHAVKEKPVVVSIGRFGPYVGCDGEFRSLDKNEDIFGVTLERAVSLLDQPKPTRAKRLLKTLGTMPGTETPVEVYEGRYGPYVTNGSVNATLPKTVEPMQVTLEEAFVLLAAAAEKKPFKAKRRAAPARKSATASAKKAPAKKKSAAKKTAAKKSSS